MTCDEARRLLELDVDGELDVVRHLELAEHIKTCPDCAARADALRARKTALRAKLPRHPAPPEFAAKLRASIVPGNAATGRRHPEGFTAMIYLRRVAGLAALVAVSLLVGYSFGNHHGGGNLLVAEAIDSHVRSLEAGPLMEVVSTDQHTVKPWFAGKLDFSPPVLDLASEGFPLIGGRRDRLAGQTVAVLVFHRHQHTINLYIWPASAGSSPIPGRARDAEQNGYHTERWTANGFAFLAVSDVSAADLAQFAKDYRTPDASERHRP